MGTMSLGFRIRSVSSLLEEDDSGIENSEWLSSSSSGALVDIGWYPSRWLEPVTDMVAAGGPTPEGVCIAVAAVTACGSIAADAGAYPVGMAGTGTYVYAPGFE